MTPVKAIWIILDSVFTLDWADGITLQAACGNEENAMIVGVGLATVHRVRIWKFNTRAAGMVIEEEPDFERWGWDENSKPRLGLATTGEMLKEIECRGRIIEGREMAVTAQKLLDSLPANILDYKTADVL